MLTARTAGVAIMAIWLTVVGWHVRREYFQPESMRLAAGARMLAPDAHAFVIRMDGAAIGMAQSALDTVAGGFAFRDETTLDVPALGSLRRAVARTRILLGESLDLRSFQFSLDSEIGRYGVDGSMEGDSVLVLVLDAGGAPDRSRVRAAGGILLDAALSLRMAASGALRRGNTFTVTVFDPSTLAGRDVVVRVRDRETIVVADSARFEDGRWVVSVLDTVPVWRVEQEFGGVAVTNWVDEDGQIVRAESPLGFTIERTHYELARQEWRAAQSRPLAEGYGALIEGTAISSNADLSDVEERPRLAVRLRDVDLAGFELDGGRQSLRGDTLVVAREGERPAPYRLPWAGGGDPARELEATPLIQADDPRIRAAAQRIAAGETDPARVARRLNDWVHGALRKEVTLSVPSAVQVLEAGQGDCNEHTVLYVALARALGLPARTAVGLVHLRGRFYYHAWPEVWLDDWVAVDPTLGQYPADASHLRFLTGGLARQVELVRLIGRLRLEVL
ncbi:MAG TPA: transglutaminase-like domain-containing protein [Longimicrobiales bacterium]|nr:transglutaminase-like domain-containing protein [Longimicrobiales bacterium]